MKPGVSLSAPSGAGVTDLQSFKNGDAHGVGINNSNGRGRAAQDSGPPQELTEKKPYECPICTDSREPMELTVAAHKLPAEAKAQCECRACGTRLYKTKDGRIVFHLNPERLVRN